MTPVFPLQTLLDLAQEASSGAAARLGQVSRHKLDLDQRLQMLLDYHQDYSQRLQASIQAGMDSMTLRNFRDFLERIEAAIAQQREQIAGAAREVEAEKKNWMDQRRKLKSFDTLSQRHQRELQQHEYRREQKAQDEFAQRGFSCSMMLGQGGMA